MLERFGRELFSVDWRCFYMCKVQVEDVAFCSGLEEGQMESGGASLSSSSAAAVLTNFSCDVINWTN